MSVTLGAIKTAAGTHLGDVAHTIWEGGELGSYAKEGYDNLVRSTGMRWKKDTPAGLVPVASTGTYTLPTDLLLIERLTWKRIKLEPIRPTEAELIAGPLYRTTTGDIHSYIVDGDGINTVRYVRVPAANGAASDISIEYQQRGAVLSSDTIAIEIPDRYGKYIRWFVMWKALERDGPGQNLELAEHYRERYHGAVARVLRRKQRASSSRVLRMGGGQPRDLNPRPRLPWNYGKVVR